MPDRHTLLMVSAGTVIGMPALAAACRAGIWPAPAVRTWPMITYSTASGLTPALSSAPLMATAPRSAPEKSFIPPSRRPIGVRAPATRTEVRSEGSRRSATAVSQEDVGVGAGCRARTAGDPGCRDAPVEATVARDPRPATDLAVACVPG